MEKWGLQSSSLNLNEEWFTVTAEQQTVGYFLPPFSFTCGAAVCGIYASNVHNSNVVNGISSILLKDRVWVYCGSQSGLVGKWEGFPFDSIEKRDYLEGVTYHDHHAGKEIASIIVSLRRVKSIALKVSAANSTQQKLHCSNPQSRTGRIAWWKIER